MNKHTPNPWRYVAGNDTAPGYVAGPEAGQFVCQLLSHDGKRNPELEAANGQLIASAPELLQALRRSQRWLSKFIADRPEIDETGLAAVCNRQFQDNLALILRSEGD